MAAPARARFRRHERLTRGREYRRVFREGIRLDGPLFSLIAAENRLSYSRCGLATSRKVGGAVARNRAKRLLREILRRHKTVGLDLVLVAKPALPARTLTEVERELTSRLQRLASRRRTRPGGSGAPGSG